MNQKIEPVKTRRQTQEKPGAHEGADKMSAAPRRPVEQPEPGCSGAGNGKNRREAVLVEAERIAHLGSYEWDIHTDSVYRSEELCHIFGVTLEQFKPTFEGYLERVHPEDRSRTRSIIENAFRERIPFEFEERIVHPDGSVHDLYSQGKWLFDCEQNPVKLIGICQDITERKRSETALQESESRYRAVVENVPEGMIVSIDRLIVFANPASAAILGVKSAQELNGHPFTDFVCPESLPMIESRREQMLRTGQAVPPAECKLVGAGRVVDAEVTGIPIVFRGRKAVLRSFRDIGESKFAAGLLSTEKHVLERIAKRLPLMDVLEEICLQIEKLNPPVMASIMLLDPDEKRMRPAAAPSLPDRWTHAITPLQIGPVVGSCGTAAFRRETVVSEDISRDPLWMAYPDILKIALDCGLRACWSTPILSATDEILGTFALYYKERRKPAPRDCDLIRQVTHLASVAIEHDRALTGLQRAHDELEDVSRALRVTVEEKEHELLERRRAEAETRALNTELEDRVQRRTRELAIANRELEAFVGAVSHDLRSPLKRINGLAELLVEDYGKNLPADGRELTDRIGAESRRMYSLVEALLNLSQATHGKLQKANVDLSRLASEIAGDLRRQQPARAVEIVIAPGITVNGDPALLRSALQNLLDNAWKFTSKRERARIEFGVTGDDPPALFVRDNGAGFDSNCAANLFVPFQRLHSYEEFPGTGVGLATVHQIISRHGGRIWADSAPDKGATFFFTLP